MQTAMREDITYKQMIQFDEYRLTTEYPYVVVYMEQSYGILVPVIYIYRCINDQEMEVTCYDIGDHKMFGRFLTIQIRLLKMQLNSLFLGKGYMFSLMDKEAFHIWLDSMFLKENWILFNIGGRHRIQC